MPIEPKPEPVSCDSRAVAPRVPQSAACRMVASLLLALLPAVALCLLHAPVYATPPDDFVQELFARCQFQAAASSLMPYTLVFVSAPLSALYQLVPQVPWYALMLLAMLVVSFWIAWSQLLSLGLSRARLVCLGAVLLSCEIVCVWYFTYTIVAFIVLAAGLMLIMPRAVFGDAGRLSPADVAGYVLVALGFSLRPESGIAALALFVPFLVWALARSRRAGTLLRAVAVIAVIAISYGAGQAAYRATPGWEDFPSYLDAGRKVLDTQRMDVSSVREQAPELSENDVAMMYDWDFVDHEVFSTDLFERISKAESAYGLAHLIASLKAKVTYLLIALSALLLSVAAALSRMRSLEKSVRALSFGVVAMALLNYMLIVMRGRPRLHIVIPMAIVTLFALLVCCQGPTERRGRHNADMVSAPGARARVVAAITCVVCAVGLGMFWVTTVRPLQSRLSLPFAAAASEYVESHPDELVVFGHTQSAWFSGTDAFASASWQCPDNILLVGGWESETAPWDACLERWGLTDAAPLMQLATRRDMTLVATEATAKLYEVYLQEHVDSSVVATKVSDLGAGAVSSKMISVWSFSSATGVPAT